MFTKKLYGSLLLIIICLITFNLSAQTNKKQVKAIRVTTPPKIDGELNEAIWDNIPVATDFFQFDPYNGEPATQKTEIKIVYNDNALFIGAMMFDTAPDSILTGLAKRDDFEYINADIFTIDISPYNDGLYAFSFKVSASGVQGDEKLSPYEKDVNWDAVWESSVKINDKGWVAEIKIPYAAIRFPKKDIQIWGINFWRNIRRKREWATWTFVNKKINSVLAQSGELTNLENIKPPLRLSVSPYVSAYLEKIPSNKNWRCFFNGGMDLKYGINESFTLDMTLIPDFGQVESDDIELNLSPFEIKYDEKRQFFTEATEIFNKGGIFYSRRIGTIPVGYYEVEDSLKKGERIISNPSETQLINATKISGRTKKGLGIGFFNAMTSNTYAVIADSNGNEHNFKTQPFTNYNMIVFDQSLKNNSYISIANTNLLRAKDKYSANVTATDFKIVDKTNIYAVGGKFIVSQKYNSNEKPDFGYRYSFFTGKISGNFIIIYSQNVESDKYDPNDMGFLYNNNEFTNEIEMEYNIYDPFWKLLNWYNNLSIEYSSLYKPRKYTDFEIFYNTRITTKKFLTMGFETHYEPFEVHDYFEARIPGRLFIRPSSYHFSYWLSTDYRKKLAFDCRLGYWRAINKNNQYSYWYMLSPRLRLSDKIMLIYEFFNDYDNNDFGYVKYEIDSLSNQIIYFGKRNQTTFVNSLTASYIFNNKESLNFRIRHYWSKVVYNEFYTLKENGYLEKSDYKNYHNINFNIFNIDLAYSWYFAPGSQMSIVWKNAINTEENIVESNFFKNFKNMINSPQANSFSVKILYYLDYKYLIKSKKKIK
ncbi:MAG: hypothetical protein KAT33_02205 [Bacteroidales bacterium]|nr:hypothetical protein [Bacteroidales bacterium]